jgi:two-component system sensor histidine kinase UhpB
MTVAGQPGRTEGIPLFLRLFVPNACVLTVACLVLIVAPANGRVPVLVGGLAVMLAANLLLMRRAFAPLMRLTGTMNRVDPLRPGERVPIDGPASEVTVLARSFNAMLDRIETERRESARRMAAAEEAEHRRVASELHDEIGQTLTALVLQLGRIRTKGAAPDDVAEAERTAESALEDVRRVARRLRPEALDELGLPAALTALCNRLSRQTGLVIRRSVPESLASLSPDEQLGLCRIAQESLTNVIRHAEASGAELRLEQHGRDVELSVVDDGVGFAGNGFVEGSGIRGMRERALLIGATMTWTERAAGGTEVRLRLPVEDGSR